MLIKSILDENLQFHRLLRYILKLGRESFPRHMGMGVTGQALKMEVV